MGKFFARMAPENKKACGQAHAFLGMPGARAG
jgi:hypothetical protein